jgi:endonuclease/exonuclease/phosphatase family metal-dependent hydrolase
VQKHPLKHKLSSSLEELRKVGSTAELLSHPIYKQRQDEFRQVLDGYVSESFTNGVPNSQHKHVRICSWNVERGLAFEGISHFLENHPIISASDILILTETDFGMARTGNLDVARQLAEKLSMNYAFAPCYMNLDKGSGIENLAEGDNEYGLHGNSILSRYPIKDVSVVRLKNGKDKMRGKEKRIGSQQAVVCTIELPGGDVRVAGFHLDAHSSQKHRKLQVKDVVDHVDRLPKIPTILGGDWNTSTYNSSNATNAIIGFWVRVFMGARYVIKNHYPYPYRLFEKGMFGLLANRGYDYESCNELGVCTVHYNVSGLKARENLGDWVPDWCFKYIDWALKPTGGNCSFKLDWFATRGLKPAVNEESLPPTVLQELTYNGEPVSDHDAIVFDFSL